VAAIAAILALYFHRKKVWPKTIIVLGLLAGIGAAGAFGRGLDWLGKQMAKGTANATATVFGIVVPGALACVMLLALFFALKPKGPGPTKWSFPIAVLLVPVLLAVGGIFGDLGGGLQDGFAAVVPATLNGVSDAVASFRR
jgi:hypothetical protein